MKLADCNAALALTAALKRCGAIKGAKKRAACVKAAHLAYRRAVALAHCQTLKGKQRARCIAKARKLKAREVWRALARLDWRVWI